MAGLGAGAGALYGGLRGKDEEGKQKGMLGPMLAGAGLGAGASAGAGAITDTLQNRPAVMSLNQDIPTKSPGTFDISASPWWQHLKGTAKPDLQFKHDNGQLDQRPMSPQIRQNLAAIVAGKRAPAAGLE